MRSSQDRGEDDVVEAQPQGSRDRAHGVEEDVVVEGVAAKGEEDQVSPPSVGRRLRLEDNWDQEPDVLDTVSSLVVKLGHERVGRVVPEDRGGRRGVSRYSPRARQAGGDGLAVMGGRRGEELLRFDNLLGQCISCVALRSECGLPQTGLPRHILRPSSDKGGVEGGVGSRCGERWGWSGERVGAGPRAHHPGGRSPRRHAEGEGRSHSAQDQVAGGIRGRVDDGVGVHCIHGCIVGAPCACARLALRACAGLQGRAACPRWLCSHEEGRRVGRRQAGSALSRAWGRGQAPPAGWPRAPAPARVVAASGRASAPDGARASK